MAALLEVCGRPLKGRDGQRQAPQGQLIHLRQAAQVPHALPQPGEKAIGLGLAEVVTLEGSLAILAQRVVRKMKEARMLAVHGVGARADHAATVGLDNGVDNANKVEPEIEFQIEHKRLPTDAISKVGKSAGFVLDQASLKAT